MTFSISDIKPSTAVVKGLGGANTLVLKEMKYPSLTITDLKYQENMFFIEYKDFFDTYGVPINDIQFEESNEFRFNPNSFVEFNILRRIERYFFDMFNAKALFIMLPSIDDPILAKYYNDISNKYKDNYPTAIDDLEIKYLKLYFSLFGNKLLLQLTPFSNNLLKYVSEEFNIVFKTILPLDDYNNDDNIEEKIAPKAQPVINSASLKQPEIKPSIINTTELNDNKINDYERVIVDTQASITTTKEKASLHSALDDINNSMPTPEEALQLANADFEPVNTPVYKEPVNIIHNNVDLSWLEKVDTIGTKISYVEKGAFNKKKTTPIYIKFPNWIFNFCDVTSFLNSNWQLKLLADINKTPDALVILVSRYKKVKEQKFILQDLLASLIGNKYDLEKTVRVNIFNEVRAYCSENNIFYAPLIIGGLLLNEAIYTEASRFYSRFNNNANIVAMPPEQPIINNDNVNNDANTANINGNNQSTTATQPTPQPIPIVNNLGPEDLKKQQAREAVLKSLVQFEDV